LASLLSEGPAPPQDANIVAIEETTGANADGEGEQTEEETTTSIAERSTAIFLGDSYTAGDGGSRYGGYVPIAGRRAGLDARPAGQGGTGIINDGGGVDGKEKFRDRVYEDVIALNPDVVVIAGGTNDAGLVAQGDVTPSQYLEEYKALLGDIKRGLPGATIVVLEPFCPGTPSSYPGMTQVRDLNKAAARAAGVPFIDVFYFTDETKSRYVGGDGFHLNDAGYEYLGKKLGADLDRVLR
jgi:lysophospholipase L1-like esterase